MPYKLLETFRGLFEGTIHRHRASTQGDRVAIQLYEDLYDLGRSPRYTSRVDSGLCVLNAANTRYGVSARRGDGTFGEIVPGVDPVTLPDFAVKRGPTATIEIGVEVKIIQKAMIRQIGRVQSDLKDQLVHFRSKRGKPITVAVVAINHAEQFVSHEDDKQWATTGIGRHKHPFQEAAEAETRLVRNVAPEYDEFLVLRFKATNVPPYAFTWVDERKTLLDYGAMLARISAAY